jgi:hypothetical protein
MIARENVANGGVCTSGGGFALTGLFDLTGRIAIVTGRTRGPY